MIVNVLSDKVAWFGKYSGYGCLVQYFPKNISIKVFNASERTVFKRIVGKFYQVLYNVTGVSTHSAHAEMRFIRNAKFADINHILYIEEHSHILNTINPHNASSIVATIHLPFSQWPDYMFKNLQDLNNVIVLYESELKKFQQVLPNSKIEFIRHGVDINYYRPGNTLRSRDKILIVGHFLRNFNMIERVIKVLSNYNNRLTFHFILPRINRIQDPLINLSKLSSVFFYENLTDDELLRFYQECTLLLLPLNDSGANTAIVQGLACGIPIVTTNNGGITSYGGGTVFPVIENNDDNAMLVLVNKYLKDVNFCNQISACVRDFALKQLSWNVVSTQHLNYYMSVCNGSARVADK